MTAQSFSKEDEADFRACYCEFFVNAGMPDSEIPEAVNSVMKVLSCNPNNRDLILTALLTYQLESLKLHCKNLPISDSEHTAISSFISTTEQEAETIFLKAITPFYNLVREGKSPIDHQVEFHSCTLFGLAFSRKMLMLAIDFYKGALHHLFYSPDKTTK